MNTCGFLDEKEFIKSGYVRCYIGLVHFDTSRFLNLYFNLKVPDGFVISTDGFVKVVEGFVHNEDGYMNFSESFVVVAEGYVRSEYVIVHFDTLTSHSDKLNVKVVDGVS